MGDDAERTEVMATVPERVSEGPKTSVVHDTTTLAERYTLLGLLGSGGMGTVYRARDRELDELVAVKVLKRDFVRSPRELERFRREVKLARKVTHRNVVRTFDIGSDGTDRFLTMQYIDGVSLADHLRDGAYWPTERVLTLAREVCDGLVASHEAGVMHGDLKPQNVIITPDGRPVITDFGLARGLAQVSDDEDIECTEGNVIGTPAYMAPEQVEGARDLDARADIYALGCMLFRAVTGVLPWRGSSIVSTAAARLVMPPPDPRGVRPEIAPSLSAIILRCMARERSERFASVEELRGVIQLLGSGAALAVAPPRPGGGARKSLAVMTIASVGSDGTAYLARGVGEALLETLKAIPGLRVKVGTTISAATEESARDFGRSADVDIVVMGTLTREEGMVHVTLRAITVEHAFRLWAYSFASPIADILRSTQDGAASLASTLGVTTAALRPSPAAEALDLYLRGRHIYATEFFSTDAAITPLRKAHALAPEDPRIASALALALMRRHQLDGFTPDGAEEARRIAEEVIENDDADAAAHVVLALVHYDDGEHRAAAEQVRRAHAIDPHSADVLDVKGNLLLEGGQPGRAIEILREAASLDPARETLDATMARAYELIGDSHTADELLGGHRLPTRDIPRVWLTRARLLLWRRDAAGAERLLALLATAPQSPVTKRRLEYMLGVTRDGSAATVDIEDLPARPRRGAFINQVNVELLLAADRREDAEERLGNLETFSFFDLTWLDGCRLLDALRDTPTFARLRRATAARVARATEALERAKS